MTTKQTSLLVALGLFVLLLANAIYVVNQMEQAVVLQFRESVRIVRDPGLYFKIPFIQSAVILDKRVLSIEPPEQEAILADQKRIIVDAFARYRITDPLKFIQRLNTERGAADQLGTLVNSSMRQVLGTLTMKDVLSAERARIMTSIASEVNSKATASDYGVEIVDVRIRRADLPQQTSNAIFARMRSEREREAKEIRAKGDEQSQEIRSKADKDRTILLAEANRQAETNRGEGDEQALKIAADAAAKDPQFFSFYRSLQAYRTTLGSDDTTFVLSPENGFFRYFNGLR